jgi:hypothetical protein
MDEAKLALINQINGLKNQVLPGGNAGWLILLTEKINRRCVIRAHRYPKLGSGYP